VSEQQGCAGSGAAVGLLGSGQRGDAADQALHAWSLKAGKQEGGRCLARYGVRVFWKRRGADSLGIFHPSAPCILTFLVLSSSPPCLPPALLLSLSCCRLLLRASLHKLHDVPCPPHC
jgi:hypothetical protein